MRKAVVNRGLDALGLAKHPDKTFIGRISKGFDFLGYHFDRAGLTVAKATIERFVEHATRLCEQEPGEEPEASARLGKFQQRSSRQPAPRRLRRRRLGREGDAEPEGARS